MNDPPSEYPLVQYDQVGITAKRVLQAVQKQIRESCVRPKDHPFGSEDTVWWVIPSSRRRLEWPAYRYGKLYFARSDDHQFVLCGLNVEKGYTDIPLTSAKPSQFMVRGWTWYEFFDALTSDAMTKAMNVVCQASGTPVLVHVMAHDGEERGLDRLVYHWNGGGLDWREREEGTQATLGLLKGLESCRSMADLVNGIGRIGSRLNRYWLNISLGSRFTLRSDSPLTGNQAGQAGWDGDALWRSALSAWRPWFK